MPDPQTTKAKIKNLEKKADKAFAKNDFSRADSLLKQADELKGASGDGLIGMGYGDD